MYRARGIVFMAGLSYRCICCCLTIGIISVLILGCSPVPKSGPMWSNPTDIAPGSGDYFDSISCTGPEFCGAIGSQTLIVTSKGAHHWSKPAPDNTNPQSSGAAFLSCPTVGFCAAVDANGYALTYDGRSSRPPVEVEPSLVPGLIYAVPHFTSCPSDKFCLSVDTNGYTLRYQDGVWSASLPRVDESGEVTSLSCAASSGHSC